MSPQPGLLALAGSICLMLALALGWCLAGVRSSQVVRRCVHNPQYLLKAHLDFLMMTGLLFLFFLLFRQLRLEPPFLVAAAMSVGSIGNPAGFLVLALKPDLSQRPTSPFGAAMLLSFVATTMGYGGGAWLVAHAAFHMANA
jgi:hypothetical protein